MTLRQVLYGSSAVMPMPSEEIDKILTQARRRNAVTGITGILVYMDGNFLQLLEGEDPALTDTFRRIETDPRHRNLIKLIDDTIAERSFAGHNMDFRAITGQEFAANPELFVEENGRWSLREGAGVDQRLNIFIKTFLRVNEGRGRL